VPPLAPAHIQPHGPVPLTEEAVPAPHRLVVGAALSAAPFVEPHAPSTAAGGGVVGDEGDCDDEQEPRKSSEAVKSRQGSRIEFIGASVSLACFFSSTDASRLLLRLLKHSWLCCITVIVASWTR
jgi:hypothetical protein